MEFLSPSSATSLLALCLIGSTAFSSTARADNPVDDGVRRSIRLESENSRNFAATASDTLVTGLVSAPILLNGTPLVQTRADGTAWRNLAVDAGAFAFTGAATLLTKSAVGRPRPYVQECASNSTYDSGCLSEDRNRSFFSGHTSWAFTGAGLICSKTFSSPRSDGGWCAASLGLAGATGVLRIMADKHYASDVLTGAGVGVLSGLLIPAIFKSAGPESDSESRGSSSSSPSSSASALVLPSVSASPEGADSGTTFGITAQISF